MDMAAAGRTAWVRWQAAQPGAGVRAWAFAPPCTPSPNAARDLSWQAARRTGGSGESWGAVAVAWHPTHARREWGEALSAAASTKSESGRPAAGALRLRSLSPWQARQSWGGGAGGLGSAGLVW